MNRVVSKHPFHSPYAGAVSRSVAFIIDLVIISTCCAIGISVLQLLGSFFHLNIGEVLLNNPLLGTIAVGLGALFQSLYFVVFWSINGQTPGKMLVGLRVIGVNGDKVGFLRAILRYFGYWLSAVVVLLGFLWVLIDQRRQGWHDKIGRTVVVYAWEAQFHHEFVEHARRRALGKGQQTNTSN